MRFCVVKVLLSLIMFILFRLRLVLVSVFCVVFMGLMFMIWGFMFIIVELMMWVRGFRLYCFIVFFEVIIIVVVLLFRLLVLLVVIVLFGWKVGWSLVKVLVEVLWWINLFWLKSSGFCLWCGILIFIIFLVRCLFFCVVEVFICD